MALQIKVVRKELRQELGLAVNLFFNAQTFRTVFQSPQFFHFYRGLAYHEPVYLIARHDDGEIAGILLAVLIREGDGLIGILSQRCVVYGGPMVADDRPEVIGLLLRHLNQTMKRQALFTQFRNFRQWGEEVERMFEAHGFVLRDRLNSLVALQKKKAVAEQFSTSRRRQLKKALHEGVTVTVAQSEQEVDALYDLLERLYKQKVKKPLPDRQFFQQCFHELVPQGAAVILLVWHNEKLIGGIVSPITAEYSIAELYVVGLDKEYPNCYPSVVATWAAMDYGQRNGLQYFDFMGLGRPGVPYGVRDFKLRFGGSEVNFGRFARRNNQLLYAVAEFGFNLWRRV